MAQDWAIAFYKSPAWRKNRRSYLNALVDTSGRVVTSDGESYSYVDERGRRCEVPPSSVVPPGMCERCFVMGRLTPAKVVHHKVHLTPTNVTDPHVGLAYDNLQRLCQDCHADVHSGSSGRRAEFDDDGMVVPREESFEEMVVRLTETVDDRRNLHASKTKA